MRISNDAPGTSVQLSTCFLYSENKYMTDFLKINSLGWSAGTEPYNAQVFNIVYAQRCDQNDPAIARDT